VLRRWVIGTASILGIASTALAQAPSGRVSITIEVASPHVAHVEGRYVVTPTSIALKVLTRPCATIENLHIERNGVAMGMAQSRNGPWITYRDTTAFDGEFLVLVVQYHVQLTGAGVIPLVHLASAVTPDDSTRLGPVRVDVRFADGAGTVSFPHMTRQASGVWSARYAAVPSFVQIAGGNLAPCDETAGERGDNGGLVWRFFLLVGIMVAWVPLYLAWARRSEEDS